MPETDPRNRLFVQPDVVTRMMLERLERGPLYKLARMVKRGPVCPAAVLWLETGHEPSCPDNDMRGTRPRHVAAFVSGEYAPPERVYENAGPGTREITRDEYEALLREISLARDVGRYHPALYPYKPIDIDRLELPFQEEANAQRRPATAVRRRAAQQ